MTIANTTNSEIVYISKDKSVAKATKAIFNKNILVKYYYYSETTRVTRPRHIEKGHWATTCPLGRRGNMVYYYLKLTQEMV